MIHRAILAGVSLGHGLPVAVMGALNVSPESFHPGSVHTEPDDLLDAARAMVDAGAALIDVGARSTAPYGASTMGDDEERERLARAVEALAATVPVPISADTARPGPARAALDAGARVINDVSGLRHPEVAGLIRERGAGAILMAFPGRAPSGLSPTASVNALLQESLGRARGAGIAGRSCGPSRSVTSVSSAEGRERPRPRMNISSPTRSTSPSSPTISQRTPHPGDPLPHKATSGNPGRPRETRAARPEDP